MLALVHEGVFLEYARLGAFNVGDLVGEALLVLEQLDLLQLGAEVLGVQVVFHQLQEYLRYLPPLYLMWLFYIGKAFLHVCLHLQLGIRVDLGLDVRMHCLIEFQHSGPHKHHVLLFQQGFRVPRPP